MEQGCGSPGATFTSGDSPHPGFTWNTVTMAHRRESKFFLSGTVSPVSVFRLNLQPKRCIPRMLRGGGRGAVGEEGRNTGK